MLHILSVLSASTICKLLQLSEFMDAGHGKGEIDSVGGHVKNAVRK